jgi:hypothetical protein
VAYKKENPKAFQGPKGLKEMIRLVPHDGRRAYTLWQNTQWKEKISDWCSTAVGRRLFNFSLWTELSRCRVDDVSRSL